MNFWYKIFLMGMAGGLGAVSRYALAGLVQSLAGMGIPVGTLVVNVLGCLGAGFVWAWMEHAQNLSVEVRAIILVGFFGAFTTFSTFALETVVLLRGGYWASAAGNLVMHNTLGLFALILGIMLARATL